jgi:hypothetical protein
MEASILCFLEPGYDTGGATALHGLMDKGQCGSVCRSGPLRKRNRIQNLI